MILMMQDSNILMICDNKLTWNSNGNNTFTNIGRGWWSLCGSGVIVDGFSSRSEAWETDAKCCSATTTVDGRLSFDRKLRIRKHKYIFETNS